MLARARVVVERGPGGRSVVRELRSQPPLALLPQRGAAAGRSPVATVHVVGSAAAPLGGDELELRVVVGPGARLRLRGVAATLALPGPTGGGSRADVRVEIADGGALEYLPEPTVVTARACHEARLRAGLAAGAALRAREILVLGRHDERPGRLGSALSVERAGRPLLRQRLDIGEPALAASPALFAGRRVLATELLVAGHDSVAPAGGDWWSIAPLAPGACLSTALACDAVTALRWLDEARAAHPAWSGDRAP